MVKTVHDYIEEREAIRAKIRAAKIGVGANKVRDYHGADRRACQFRKTEWEIKLACAQKELAEFDVRMTTLSVSEGGDDVHCIESA